MTRALKGQARNCNTSKRKVFKKRGPVPKKKIIPPHDHEELEVVTPISTVSVSFPL